MHVQTISNEYRDLQKQMHAEKAQYGANGHKAADMVLQIGMAEKCETFLDYGCGKATLQAALPQFKFTCYDPAIARFSKYPSEPHDFVYCGDVMEHVEEQYVNTVLDELARLTKKICVLNVACAPATKHLPDGRNAHITIRPYMWWLNHIADRFVIVNMINTFPAEFMVVCHPNQSVLELN